MTDIWRSKNGTRADYYFQSCLFQTQSVRLCFGTKHIWLEKDHHSEAESWSQTGTRWMRSEPRIRANPNSGNPALLWRSVCLCSDSSEERNVWPTFPPQTQPPVLQTLTNTVCMLFVSMTNFKGLQTKINRGRKHLKAHGSDLNGWQICYCRQEGVKSARKHGSLGDKRGMKCGRGAFRWN